jgi:hypothetical protein
MDHALTTMWYARAMLRRRLLDHHVMTSATYTSRRSMYVIVQHRIKGPQTAFARGEKLMPLGGGLGGIGPVLCRLRSWRLQREHELPGE